MKAFAYIRLSKWDEGTTSPQRQRQAVEAFCQARGWELLETFEDIDVSAYNGHRRPGLEKMLSRLPEVGAVVFMRLDRLARSVTDFARIRETCSAAGVELVSTDQQIDTSTAMGKAMQSIVATFAELESGTISERSRKMMAYKRERGEPVGRVPFGWKRNGKEYEPDPDQQAILAEAARRYVAGETLAAIASDLGFSAPGPLSRMLQSDRVQEALPAEQAEALREALKSRLRERVPSSHRSLLGGIATCGQCGATMTAGSTRANRRGRWFSYGCRQSGHVHISAPWLDNYVSEKVVDMVDTGRLTEAISQRRKSKPVRKVSDLEARLEILENAYYVEGKMPESRFRRLRDELLERLEKARRSERERGADLPAETVRDLAERWAALDVPARRKVIAAVLREVEVAKATGNGAPDPSRVRLVWRVQIEGGE
jgi:site-specific DNA recombinase